MRAWLGFTMLCACADIHENSHIKVAMEQAMYPVSMSEYIVTDQTITRADALQVVGQLKHTVPCIEPGKASDISEAINAQVKKANGEGVVAFMIETMNTSDCDEITVSGDIVRRK